MVSVFLAAEANAIAAVVAHLDGGSLMERLSDAVQESRQLARDQLQDWGYTPAEIAEAVRLYTEIRAATPPLTDAPDSPSPEP